MALELIEFVGLQSARDVIEVKRASRIVGLNSYNLFFSFYLHLFFFLREDGTELFLSTAGRRRE